MAKQGRTLPAVVQDLVDETHVPITPKRDRPRCGAKTRSGGKCQARAVWDREKNKPRNGRCRMHGGNLRGPTTKLGRAICRVSALLLNARRLARLAREPIEEDTEA